MSEQVDIEGWRWVDSMEREKGMERERDGEKIDVEREGWRGGERWRETGKMDITTLSGSVKKYL